MSDKSEDNRHNKLAEALHLHAILSFQRFGKDHDARIGISPVDSINEIAGE